MPKLPIKNVYMRVAYEFAKCSYAIRRQVGAVIVKNKRIISFGYNGTPNQFDNECEHQNKDGSLTTVKEVLHAESNAITKVAKSTMSCEGAKLFTTTAPCFDCSKLIIQSGIKKVYYTETYRDMSGIELLEKANIKVERIAKDQLNIND